MTITFASEGPGLQLDLDRVLRTLRWHTRVVRRHTLAGKAVVRSRGALRVAKLVLVIRSALLRERERLGDNFLFRIE